MKNVLVTGGTVFVSKYVAEYFGKKEYNVFVLNRNTKEQPQGVTLIEGDRKNLKNVLLDYHFDIILDITAYTQEDINSLLDGVGDFEQYIMVSSSAVYPESCQKPFTEETPVGENIFWGSYGTGKIAAESALISRCPDAYILRPPYLYGPMDNVYREAFVFECALNDRKFYLPQDGQLNLQFFHVDDLCRFMELIIEKKPEQHIFNVGNKNAVTIKEWVCLCYLVAGKKAEFENVYDNIEQRKYFCFNNYDYFLDVSKQCEIMPDTQTMVDGLNEAFNWYINNSEKIYKRDYIEYIDTIFC